MATMKEVWVDYVPKGYEDVIQGAPHVCTITHPEESCSAVENFISRFD